MRAFVPDGRQESGCKAAAVGSRKVRCERRRKLT